MGITISGRLAQDARLGVTASDEPVAHISIVLRSEKPGDATVTATWRLPQPGFASLYAARAIERSLRKGTMVHVYGGGLTRYGADTVRVRDVSSIQPSLHTEAQHQQVAA